MTMFLRTIFVYSFFGIVLLYCVNEALAEEEISQTMPGIKYVYSVKQSDTSKLRTNVEDAEEVVLIFPSKEEVIEDSTASASSKEITIVKASPNTTSESLTENSLNATAATEKSTIDYSSTAENNLTDETSTKSIKHDDEAKEETVNVIRHSYFDKFKKIGEESHRTRYKTLIKKKKNSLLPENGKNETAENNETIDQETSLVTDTSSGEKSKNQTNSEETTETNNKSRFDSWKSVDMIPFTLEDALIPSASENEEHFVSFKKYKPETSSKKSSKKPRKPTSVSKERQYTKHSSKDNEVIKNQDEIEYGLLINEEDRSYHHVLEAHNPTIIRGLLIVGPIPKMLPEEFTREPYVYQLTPPKKGYSNYV